jgi:hypothetical protein
MGKAIYCPFPTCTVEYYTYCAKHRAIRQQIEEVAEHLDPENILTRSVVYANLMPMIRLLEQQWTEIHRLERRVSHYESELRRIEGGR